MSFTVAIIGRPNVGKSTLFNRLAGRPLALVDDMPGVTRDRREGEGHIADLNFRLIDTAGLEEAAPGYWTNDDLEGVRAFALWPLAQAAESTFGSPTWPREIPAPQAWLVANAKLLHRRSLAALGIN